MFSQLSTWELNHSCQAMQLKTTSKKDSLLGKKKTYPTSVFGKVEILGQTYSSHHVWTWHEQKDNEPFSYQKKHHDYAKTFQQEDATCKCIHFSFAFATPCPSLDNRDWADKKQTKQVLPTQHSLTWTLQSIKKSCVYQWLCHQQILMSNLFFIPKRTWPVRISLLQKETQHKIISTFHSFKSIQTLPPSRKTRRSYAISTIHVRKQ